MPDVLGALGQFDALDLAPALAVEQTKLDLLRVGGKQREIGPPSVPACTEARGRSGCQSHKAIAPFPIVRHDCGDPFTNFGNERSTS